MISIARPSRRVRESATAMRYWGLRILPSRLSLIFTDMVKRLLLWVSRCNSAIRAGCRNPVLPRVSAAPGHARKGTVAGRTAAHCARAWPRSENSPGLVSGFREFSGSTWFPPDGSSASPLGCHPPALWGAEELVVVPEPAKHHLPFISAEDHRVEADCSRRRGVPVDAHREVAQHVRIHREIRQHLSQPGLHLRIAALDAPRAV